MDFFFLAFGLQQRKIFTSFVYLRIELAGLAKNGLIFSGANYGSTYSMSKYYNWNVIHFNGMPVKTYFIVFHSKDVMVLLFSRRKIKGRDKNPTPCKIQYPMKNQSKILSGIPLVLYDYTSMLYNSHILGNLISY